MDYDYADADTEEPLSDNELHERYDDMLDEVYGPVTIGGEYMPSEILKNVDPIAYRVGFSEYIDFELQDGRIVEYNEDEN